MAYSPCVGGVAPKILLYSSLIIKIETEEKLKVD